jgi:hypothetical protein
VPSGLWYAPTRPHDVITKEARSNRNNFELAKKNFLQNAYDIVGMRQLSVYID